MTIKKEITKTFNELVTADVEILSSSQVKLFNILRDHDTITRFMNIWRSFKLNADVTNDVLYYEFHEVPDGDEWWENISYDYYGTPYLWWIIAMMNNVVNPFEEIKAGDFIKILRQEYIYTLTSDIENISEL